MKLVIALASAAVLTAACAASATVSGTGKDSAKSANTIQLASGANAGSGAAGPDDVNRVNPLVGKAGTHQVPPVQPQVVQPAPVPAFGTIQDRCTVGIGTQSGLAPQNGSPGKHPPLPMCAPQ
ncbi:MAG: hypothetical protein M3077_06140 [Candidatus Dormibacteraeota bacterium]|nr:hypothetical protein [Candidatus Dormibacteraeota bacterium]